MVLAPITYGYKSHPTSGGGQLFAGTTSLDGATLIHLALDILRETYRHGGRKFLIMNGHFENVAFLTEAIDLFLRHSSDSKVLLVSWWDQVSDELVDEIFATQGSQAGTRNMQGSLKLP
jgi:creatinine amidohydrolase